MAVGHDAIVGCQINPSMLLTNKFGFRLLTRWPKNDDFRLAIFFSRVGFSFIRSNTCLFVVFVGKQYQNSNSQNFLIKLESCIKLFLNFSNSEPQYSYKLYSYKSVSMLLDYIIYGRLRGSESFLLKLPVILGGSAPPKFLYWLCFSKCIDLAFKVFCIAMVNLPATWLLRHF